jgi:four helix bundle protein
MVWGAKLGSDGSSRGVRRKKGQSRGTAWRVTRQASPVTIPSERGRNLVVGGGRGAHYIPINPTEGCSRSSEVDYAHFVEIATGTLFEVVAQATIGRNQGFLDQSGYQQGYDASEMQILMLSGLRKSLSP